MTVGERRKELNLTMLELAKKVGVSEGTISRWESGNIESMRCDKIKPLAKALNVTPSFLMGWGAPSELSLTEKEEQLIQKYRDNPSMQKAVDTLLGIEE